MMEGALVACPASEARSLGSVLEPLLALARRHVGGKEGYACAVVQELLEDFLQVGARPACYCMWWPALPRLLQRVVACPALVATACSGLPCPALACGGPPCPDSCSMWWPAPPCLLQHHTDPSWLQWCRLDPLAVGP